MNAKLESLMIERQMLINKVCRELLEFEKGNIKVPK